MAIPPSSPVHQLLSYGDPDEFNFEQGSSYLELGIQQEHVPHLVQLLLDESLYQGEGTAGWAPVHAWRTLAQLQAEGGVDALIQVLQRWGDDEAWWEWVNEELPIVFSSIGAAALPALSTYLADATEPTFPRGTAVSSIEQIGRQHPDYRSKCVQLLTQQLSLFDQNDPQLNGYLVVALVELDAVESAAVIEQAFVAGRVDEAFMGDWDEVQVALGLKSRAAVPRKHYPLLQLESDAVPTGSTSTGGSGYARSPGAKAKVKNNRKQQKQARRQNRAKK